MMSNSELGGCWGFQKPLLCRFMGKEVEMPCSDAEIVRSFVHQNWSSTFVQNRIQRNVEPRRITISRDGIWAVVVGCILTTQQKANPDGAVARLLRTEPFPLSFEECCRPDAVVFMQRLLKDFGGIRFTNKIASQLHENIQRLESRGVWVVIEAEMAKVSEQRLRLPQPQDFVAERDAADLVDYKLRGFGPKQSRNFWQWLGFSRFEIPIDSRVAAWVNANLSFQIEKRKLGDEQYYKSTMDRLRGLCADVSVLPCVLDAAVFAARDREWRSEELTNYN